MEVVLPEQFFVSSRTIEVKVGVKKGAAGAAEKGSIG